jgi:hypothetical protein
MNNKQIEQLADLLHTITNLATIESCYIQLLHQKIDGVDEESKKYLEVLMKTNNRYACVFKNVAYLFEHINDEVDDVLA